MRKFIFLFLFVINCAIGPTGGLLVSRTQFAGYANPTNEVSSEVRAEDCIVNILGLISFGNAGAGEIAYKNKIKRIATIDHSETTVLSVLLMKYCTIVTGERGGEE